MDTFSKDLSENHSTLLGHEESSGFLAGRDSRLGSVLRFPCLPKPRAANNNELPLPEPSIRPPPFIWLTNPCPAWTKTSLIASSANSPIKRGTKRKQSAAYFMTLVKSNGSPTAFSKWNMVILKDAIFAQSNGRLHEKERIRRRLEATSGKPALV